MARLSVERINVLIVASFVFAFAAAVGSGIGFMYTTRDISHGGGWVFLPKENLLRFTVSAALLGLFVTFWRWFLVSAALSALLYFVDFKNRRIFLTSASIFGFVIGCVCGVVLKIHTGGQGFQPAL